MARISGVDEAERGAEGSEESKPDNTACPEYGAGNSKVDGRKRAGASSRGETDLAVVPGMRKTTEFEGLGTEGDGNAGGKNSLKATSGSLREQVQGKPFHPAGRSHRNQQAPAKQRRADASGVSVKRSDALRVGELDAGAVEWAVGEQLNVVELGAALREQGQVRERRATEASSSGRRHHA